jgi:hypothetical protein
VPHKVALAEDALKITMNVGLPRIRRVTKSTGYQCYRSNTMRSILVYGPAESS